jgi:RNA polymerase subunit RPABC4/transcription elongation factor Spt4
MSKKVKCPVCGNMVIPRKAHIVIINNRTGEPFEEDATVCPICNSTITANGIMIQMNPT